MEKTKTEKWLIQRMWNERREIMKINKRHFDSNSLPNDGAAHCVHRRNMQVCVIELGKERGKRINPLIEAAGILHAYCPWHKVG